MKKIAVVGGGAAGMMAAIAAASGGASVVIYEKSDRVGRKILATGNGRCNISNLRLFAETPDLSAYHGSAGWCIPHVFRRFSPADTRDFFDQIGVPFRAEGERLYPYNLQASSVQDALRWQLDRLQIPVRTSAAVTALEPSGRRWKVITGSETEWFDAVILTAGGQASPKLGSNGEGFGLCRKLKIRVTSLSPALVKLKLDSPYNKRLSGLRMMAAVTIGARTEQEEILFTDDGISGTAVFQLSGTVAGLQEPRIRIDQFPDLSANEVCGLLQHTVDTVGYKPVSEALNGLLHKKMIPVMLLVCGVDKDKKAAALRQGELRRMAQFLKNWEIPVTGTGGFANAQVTAGGVEGKEIRADLRSVRYPGLYFAGEILDVDGDCGGYNLQWAWSSGYAAGSAAAEEE